VPIPYSAHMEQAAIPQVDKIVAAVNKVVYGSTSLTASGTNGVP